MKIHHVVGGGYDINRLTFEYLCDVNRYNCTWLKAMLEEGQQTKIPHSTLVTGSSHALSCIDSKAWKQVVNCSMHSQDFYYDFCCACKVLEHNHNFDKCIIVGGYYIAFQDISSSKVWGKDLMSTVYEPIFHDVHNWQGELKKDLGEEFSDLPESIRLQVEEEAKSVLRSSGSYYNELLRRTPFYDLKSRTWAQLTEAEQDILGKDRCESHNKSFQHKASYEENKEILREFVHFLHQKGVTPILVVTPYSKAYNRYVLQDMKDAFLEMVDSVPEDVHYVDFNDAQELFTDEDFTDTDHMSEQGAEKLSAMLADMFGK